MASRRYDSPNAAAGRRCGRWRWHACRGLLGGIVLLGIAACMAPPVVVRSPEIRNGEVVFRYRAPSARLVQVAGSWRTNFGLRGRDWEGDERVGRMQRDADTGVWERAVPLGPGRYTYFFLVDGRFIELDPANPQRVPDGHGGSLSLLVVP